MRFHHRIAIVQTAIALLIFAAAMANGWPASPTPKACVAHFVDAEP